MTAPRLPLIRAVPAAGKNCPCDLTILSWHDNYPVHCTVQTDAYGWHDGDHAGQDRGEVVTWQR